MTELDINWIQLHNALTKADKQASYAVKYIYGLLDEALRRELGRVIERGAAPGRTPGR